MLAPFVLSVVYKLRYRESQRSPRWLLLAIMLLKYLHLQNLNISATNTNRLQWLMGFKRRRKCRSRCHPSPLTDSSALHGPITQVWSGVMTYHQARRGWGSMKKRRFDTHTHTKKEGWWGVNYLHLAAVSLLLPFLPLPTFRRFHPICLYDSVGVFRSLLKAHVFSRLCNAKATWY